MSSKRNAVTLSLSEPASPRGEPKTMAELLATAQSAIRSFPVGQKVKAKVIAKTPKALVLDIGGKSEGLVTEKAFIEARDFIKTLKVGDEVWVSVLISENADGYVILSLRQASFEAVWEKLSKAKEEDIPVNVVGKGAGASGVTVEVEKFIGFIPFSQLGKEAMDNPPNLIGKTFRAKIIELDKSSNKIVLSEKAVSEEGQVKLAKEALEKVKEGEVYDGEVTTVANFGCFVKIKVKDDKEPIYVEGLVHISELSWSKVENVSDLVSVRDKVKVKVIGTRDGKLSFSIKHAQKDPWDEAAKEYPAEKKVSGKVTKITDFGVFVSLEPGIEGLIHITNIPPGKKLSYGDEVNCYVQEIDPKAKKLSLGLVLTEKPVGYK